MATKKGTKAAGSRARKGRSGARSSTAGQRERIAPRGDARFVRRDAQGQFCESDDVGRSLRADRRTKAKTQVRSGYGDRGDRSGGRSRRSSRG